MLEWMAQVHRQQLEAFLRPSEVEISRQTDAGGWSAWVFHDAVVQAQQSTRAPSDPEIASVDSYRSVVVFLRHTVAVAPGDRIRWKGDIWEVNAIDEERSIPSCVKVWASRMHIGTQVELIAFRRRVGGAWVELGTFPMRFTHSFTNMARARVELQEGTAEGALMTASMVGPPETGVLQVGDWFSRDGFPGRIVGKDDSPAEHVEFDYQLERRVP